MTEASSLNTLSSSEPWSRRLAPTAKQKNRHNLFLWNNKKFVKLSNLLILVYYMAKETWRSKPYLQLTKRNFTSAMLYFHLQKHLFRLILVLCSTFWRVFFTCTHVQSMHMPLWNIDLGFHSTKYILNCYQKKILIFIAEFTFKFK